MSAPLRACVAGAGRAFEVLHWPELRERAPHIEVVAVVEPRADRREWVAEHLGPGVAVDNLAAGLARSPDLGVVCTPNDRHAAAAGPLLGHGARVLCEKPLDADPEQAAELVRVGADRLFVNLPYGLDPLLAAFADEVAALAGPVSLRATFTTAGERLWRSVGRWYDDPAVAGGGVLLDLGVHLLDVLDRVCPGLLISSVNAPVSESLVEAGSVEAEASLTGGWAGGHRLEAAVARNGRRIAFVLEAHGADGSAVVLDLRRGRLTGADGGMRRADRQVLDRRAVAAFLDDAIGRASQPAPDGARGLRLQHWVSDLYRLAAGG